MSQFVMELNIMFVVEFFELIGCHGSGIDVCRKVQFQSIHRLVVAVNIEMWPSSGLRPIQSRNCVFLEGELQPGDQPWL